MAKTSNGLGQFSGKLGGVVYVVQNGQQVVRAYQPVVSNPKSNLQLAQRSKGNLAGRISSFVPSTAIMGLGSNGRLRRGEFLSNILRMASAVKVGDEFTAKINPADVLFSKGAEVLPVLIPSVTAGAHQVSAVLSAPATTIIEPDYYASKLVRLVAMIFEANSDNLIEVSTKMAIMPAQGSTATTFIQVAYSGNYDAYVYAIPMSTADGSAVSITTSLVNLSDAEIASILSRNQSAVVFNYGRSVLGGSASYEA